MAVSDLSYEYTSPTIIMVLTICYVFVMNYPSLGVRNMPDHSTRPVTISFTNGQNSVTDRLAAFGRIQRHDYC